MKTSTWVSFVCPNCTRLFALPGYAARGKQARGINSPCCSRKCYAELRVGKSRNAGESNGAYSGDAVGYAGVHAWVKRRLPKPSACQHCEKDRSLDLANKSGRYLRDLTDWEYLCRQCHMDSDGRSDALRIKNAAVKASATCRVCNKQFYRRSGMRDAKFCSRACYFAQGGRWGAYCD